MKHRFAPAVVTAIVVTAAGSLAPPAHAAPPPGVADRGAYLVRIMDCSACHTPMILGKNGPEPDMSRFLSGHPADLVMPAPPETLGRGPWVWAGSGTNTAFAGPWGVSFAANLTPDPDTGMGSWSEETFVRAIRTGRHLGAGRPILPPMPIPAYSGATDDDLKAIFAYLRTIPAIRNAVPQPVEPPEAR